MSRYTNQQAFEKAYLALRKQGKPSLDANGLCMYRGDHETKCAVGHLVEDEDFPRMTPLGRTRYEGTGPGDWPAFASELVEGGHLFLRELQVRIHDDYPPGARDRPFVPWLDTHAAEFARSWDLEMPKIEETES